MKNRVLILICSVSFLMSLHATAYARESEVIVKDEVVNAIETDVESNFTSKDYFIEGEDKGNYLVEGGNENAVNMLATEQSTAGGSITENVGVNGQAYDMTIPKDEDFTSKDPLELRQFITFETKSGKVFHIIVDHGKDSDNVTMLTEVSEQDLLNLIEDQAGVAIGVVEENNETSAEGEPIVVHKEDPITNKEVQDSSTTDLGDEPKDISMIIIIGIATLSGIGGWYFKIYKPKRNAAFEEEVDEADYIDEELVNEDEDYE